MAQTLLQNHILRLAAGERLFSAGEPGETMYIVQSGQVRVFTGTGDNATTLAVMGKGEFFGEMSLLEGTPRTVSAEALEGAELIEINSAAFDRMVHSNVEIAVRMIRKLAVRVGEAESRLEVLSMEAARQRPTAPAPAEPARPASRPTQPRLLAESPDRGETVFLLTRDEVLLGRYDPVTETQPEVDLTVLDTKKSVSRRHARISASKGSWFLREEPGALSGTFLNGTRLVSGRPVEVHDGDVVGIGALRLLFRL